MAKRAKGELINTKYIVKDKEVDINQYLVPKCPLPQVPDVYKKYATMSFDDMANIISRERIDWSKGADVLSQELENFFSSFWGKEHKKSVDYDADFLEESVVYTNIHSEWGKTRFNETSCKGSFFLSHRGKVIVIAIEPK